MFHRNSSVRSCPNRGRISHHAGAAESEISVHDGQVSSGVVVAAGHRVERGPEHPEEDGADEGEDVRVVLAALGGIVDVAALEEAARDGEAEIGAKSVDHHRTTDVRNGED